MSSPPSSTLPLVGLCKPAIALNSVVFPAPFGPIKPVMDPCSIVNETPSTA